MTRFEVWATDTGEASHWKLTRGGVFESEAAAAAHAHKIFDWHSSVSVERWNAGTNTFINTILEEAK